MITDVKKVIQGLEHCKNVEDSCSFCPYDYESNVGRCLRDELMPDAIELLKRFEPMKPSWNCGSAYCPNCGQKLPRKHHEYKRNYCSNCGQAVIWNDR